MMALVVIWILLFAWLCAAGWILSALHALNGPGYLIALTLTAAVGMALKKEWWPAGGFRLPNWRKLWRQFQRPAPLIEMDALAGAARVHGQGGFLSECAVSRPLLSAAGAGGASAAGHDSAWFAPAGDSETGLAAHDRHAGIHVFRTRLSIAAYWEFTTRHSAGEAVAGFATIPGGVEPAMWHPCGHGRIERILIDDTLEWVRTRGIHGVFVDELYLAEKHETIEQWLKRFDATLLDQITFTTGPGAHFHLYFARLQSTNSLPAETVSK